VARPYRHHASCGDRREDLTSSLWQFSSSVSRLSGCLAGSLQLEGRRPMSTIAGAVLTADRIDNWIRRQVTQYWLRYSV
jgi:hypothetical protein